MTDLSYAEVWTNTDSSLVSVSTAYIELAVSATKNITSSDDWMINDNGYLRLVYSGEEERKFLCVATLSLNSNKSSAEFYITFSVNGVPQAQEKQSSVSVSGKPVETTVSAVLNISPNDTISIYCRSKNGAMRISVVRSDFIVYALNGVRGPQGIDGVSGSGSSLIIKNNGTNIPNTPHSSINFTGSCDITEGSDVVTVNVKSSVFGAGYNYVENDAEYHTTRRLNQKLVLTTNSLPLGDYRLSWYAEITNQEVGRSVWAELNSGSAVLSSDIYTSQLVNTGEYWHIFSGFKKLSSISGVKTFNLVYGIPHGDGVAKIRNMRIELYRTV